MTIFTFFFTVLVANFEFAGFSPKQKYTARPFPWKRFVLQNPDRERTNQSSRICLRLVLPDKSYLTIIPRARMGSQSIPHEAEGRMGY